MKKTILTACLILTVASGVAFGAAVPIPLTGTSIGSQTFKPSNNVNILVNSLPGDSLNIGGYSVAAYHSNGNREFASNSSESKIYWRDSPTTHIAVGGVTVTAGTPAPTFTPDFTSGWNSL